VSSGERQGHEAHSRPHDGADRDRRAADHTLRLREVVEGKVVDIHQVDVNHVGGFSALWKVAAMAVRRGS
jgi:hypothetical protein